MLTLQTAALDWPALPSTDSTDTDNWMDIISLSHPAVLVVTSHLVSAVYSHRSLYDQQKWPHDNHWSGFQLPINTRTRAHTFNGPFYRTTRVSRYQKGKTNLDFTEARDSEWQWHQLGHMQVQVCTSLQTDNHTSTPSLSFLQAGCPSCHPTNSIKAIKVLLTIALTD